VVKDLFESIGAVSSPIQIEKTIIPAVAKKLTVDVSSPYTIQLKCQNWQANQISGWLERESNSATIYFSASLNACFSRFVVCKELAHLLIDSQPKHFTKNPVLLVQELISKLPSSKLEHDSHPANRELSESQKNIQLLKAVRNLRGWF
jgi:hypothetical protein